MNTLNRTPNEITKIFNDFVSTEENIRQIIRNYFSRQLMDTNEVDKMDVDIVVDVEDAT